MLETDANGSGHSKKILRIFINIARFQIYCKATIQTLP